MRTTTISRNKVIAALLIVVICFGITCNQAFAASTGDIAGDGPYMSGKAAYGTAGDGTSTATTPDEYDYSRIMLEGVGRMGRGANELGYINATVSNQQSEQDIIKMMNDIYTWDKEVFKTGCRESSFGSGYYGAGEMTWGGPVCEHNENVKWELKDGTLTFSGDGWCGGGIVRIGPWARNPYVKHIVVEEGVHFANTSCFEFIPNLETITYESTLHHIEIMTMRGTPNLKTITIGEYEFPVTKLGNSTFHYGVDYGFDFETTDYKFGDGRYDYWTGVIDPDELRELAERMGVTTLSSSNEGSLIDQIADAMANGDEEKAQELTEQARAEAAAREEAERKAAEEEAARKAAEEAAAREEAEKQAAENREKIEEIRKQFIAENIGNKTVSEWAQLDVATAIATGIVPNNLGNDYTKAITREQFCDLAVALYESTVGANETITGRSYFNDTNSVNVQKMASLGVVTGYGDGVFGPDDLITREQAATIMYRLDKAIKTALGDPSANNDDHLSRELPFTDTPSSWAKAGIQYCYDHNIMRGYSDELFGIQDAYSIEQSIITIYRIANVEAGI